MTLKEYCKEHRISAKSIADTCAIPYSTVNDLLNGKTELERTSFGVICRIADCLELGLDDFRGMFAAKSGEAGSSEPQIIVRNKRYQLIADGERMDLCKVSSLNEKYIDSIAEWTLRDLRIRKEVKKANDRLMASLGRSGN